MSLLINIAAQFSGKKALKDAQKQVTLLEGSVKKLGSTLGVSLSTAAVVAFGKASVKAFMDDQKAAAILSNTVKNLGLSFADANIKTFIDQLAIASGVVDDELRPAMQRLLQATKSLSMSQDLLKQSIDFAKGSGQSLETVILDISNAYVGNNKGLKKYTLGLSAAELKTASFDKVLAAFNKNFSGANAAYLKTYAGQMGILTVAAAEAQETIGKGLIDSLALLGKDNSVSDLSKSMESLAKFTADTIYGLASMTAELKKVGGATPSWLKSIVGSFAGSTAFATVVDAVKGISAYGAKKQNAKLENPSTLMFKQDMANLRLGKEKIKNDKKIIAAQKALTAEQKKQALAKKQSALFDLEQIGIIAALKGNISEEERLRLNLQLALLTGNTKEADTLSQKLANSIDSTGKLAKSLRELPDANNPFKSWDAFLDSIIAKARLAASIGGGGSESRGATFAALTPTVQDLVTGSSGTARAGVTSGGDVYVTVNGSVVSDQDLVIAIENGLQGRSLSGSNSVIGRIQGMFG